MTKKHTILTAINSKYIHSNLAVYCLRAYAKPYIDEVEIAEYTINQQVDDILMSLYQKPSRYPLFFLLYLELEADPGNSDGIAEDPAGYGDLAGRTGGDL